MRFYSPFEWLLIDVATQKGLDKLTFEERIQWSKDNFADLESYYKEEWKEKPMYVKAVMALRDVCAGKETGHMVGVDASASGIQVMSALTGCKAGAEATGLIDPDVRADVYTTATKIMNDLLGGGVTVARSDMKKALMVSFYGGDQMPRLLFGEDTPERKAYYQAAKLLAPGAWELLQDLLGAWTQEKKHSWIAPDGFHVHVKVIVTKEVKIEVDELDHATFKYQYRENEGTAKGLSLAANFAHTIDSLVVREMHRMVNYDPVMVNKAFVELLDPSPIECPAKWIELYEKTGFATFRAIEDIAKFGAAGMSVDHRNALIHKCNSVRKWKPYPLVSVHDDYKTLPSGVNAVRFHYKELLAEISDAYILDFMFSELLNQPVKYNKVSKLGKYIKESNYGLC